ENSTTTSPPSAAPATTWLLVRMYPSSRSTKPEPVATPSAPRTWSETTLGSTLAAMSATDPAGRSAPGSTLAGGSDDVNAPGARSSRSRSAATPPTPPATSASAATPATAAGRIPRRPAPREAAPGAATRVGSTEPPGRSGAVGGSGSPNARSVSQGSAGGVGPDAAGPGPTPGQAVAPVPGAGAPGEADVEPGPGPTTGGGGTGPGPAGVDGGTGETLRYVDGGANGLGAASRASGCSGPPVRGSVMRCRALLSSSSSPGRCAPGPRHRSHAPGRPPRGRRPSPARCPRRRRSRCRPTATRRATA